MTRTIDEAWKEAEAAMPKGWHVGRLIRAAPAFEERWYVEAQHSPGPNRNYETKHAAWWLTPVAALDALAAMFAAPAPSKKRSRVPVPPPSSTREETAP